MLYQPKRIPRPFRFLISGQNFSPKVGVRMRDRHPAALLDIVTATTTCSGVC